MLSGLPILPMNAIEQPPIGYYLSSNAPGETYAVRMKSFTDSMVHFAAFTDSTAYSYHRSDSDSTQTDNVSFGSGFTFSNKDPQTKKLLLKAIVPLTDAEHSFHLMNYSVNMNDSVGLKLSGQTGLLLRNTGGLKWYDLKIVNNNPGGGKTYIHKWMTLDTNSSNMLIPTWSGHDSEQIRILIDHGNKGSYDDSMVISALGTPSVLGHTPYLDLTFGNQGTIDMFLPGDVGEYVNAGAIQPDGKILVAGNSMVPHYNAAGVDTGDTWEFFVSRFNTNGTLDASFGTGGVARTQIVGGTFLEDYANAMALQPDGKIVLAGRSVAGVNAANTTTAFALARFNTDGSIDNTFGTNGTVRTKIAGGNNYDAASALIIQPDGKIIAAGSSGTWSFSSFSYGNIQFAVARYNADGTLDPTFGPNGGTVRTPISGSDGQSDYVYSAARQQDGRIILAGMSDNNYIEGIGVARFDTSGHLDPTFGSSGGTVRILPDSLADAEVSSVMIQPDGKIILAGNMMSKTFTASFGAVRLNSDATPDSSYGVSGVASLHVSRTKYTSDQPHCAVLQPDGKLIVAGQTGDSADYTSFGVARFTINGFSDSTFGVNGSFVNHIGSTSGPNEGNVGRWVGIQIDGKIVLAGYSTPKTFPIGTGGITSSGVTLARYMPQTSFIVEGVRMPSSSMPAEWNLYQNYPNPFNPTTTISYQLMKESKVRLQVYNMLGQLVATLVDGIQQAGDKQICWNARSVATGVYFYRLEATSVYGQRTSFVKVKKMVFIK